MWKLRHRKVKKHVRSYSIYSTVGSLRRRKLEQLNLNPFKFKDKMKELLR